MVDENYSGWDAGGMPKSKPIPRGRNGGRKPDPNKRIKIAPTISPQTHAALLATGKTVYKAASDVLDEWALRSKTE